MNTNLKKVQNGVFYHIYPGSFADGNGDGIGDIKGLIGKLDYLNDGNGGGLGVTGIWLCPIHDSFTYHKYDANDFYSVDSDYGTVEDIELLVKEANKRGIHIILDLVFNCVANTSPIFIEALNNPASKYREWFYFWDKYKDVKGYSLNAEWNTLPSWQTAVTAHGEEKYIGIYHAIMPDLNFDNKEVRQMCKDVASFWLSKGVSGFRLDSAMHLYSVSEVPAGVDYHGKNIEWWTEFYEHCAKIRPDVYLVGEVWDSDPDLRARYMQGLKSDFHFFLGAYIGEAVTNGRDKKHKLREYLCLQYEAYKSRTNGDYIDAPFLSNHDDHRYYNNYVFNDADAKIAASVYLTLEGIPFIYYGEELGMFKVEGCPAKPRFKWHSDDTFLQARTAFLWGKDDKSQTDYIAFEDKALSPADAETQLENQDSLLNHYKKVIRARKKFSAIYNGRYRDYDCKNPSVFSFIMSDNQNSVYVFHNLSGEEQEIETGKLNIQSVYHIESQSENLSVGGRLTLLPKNSYICVIK